MFDVVSRADHAVPHRDRVPLLISSLVHLVMIAAVAAIPLLYVSTELPHVPDMLAFVAAAPPPPPPPPPPPARAPRAAKAETSSKRVAKPVPSVVRSVPVAAPAEIALASDGIESGVEEGIPGGVEGGVPGGIPGGVVGGILTGVVPPPLPPEPVVRAPVRVGGTITAPALVARVEPVYPALAVKARV